MARAKLFGTQTPYDQQSPEGRAFRAAQDAFLRSAEAMHGHPTSPGYNETRVNRVGFNGPHGFPGKPRVLIQPESEGPGIPGTNGRPMQPRVAYDNPYGVDNDSV